MNKGGFIKSSHRNESIRVICLNTLNRFKSLTAAAQFAGLKAGTRIRESCKGNGPAGFHPITHDSLFWMQEDDFDNLSEQEKNKKIQEVLVNHKGYLGSKAIYCLNTMMLFRSVEDAAKYYGVKCASNISNSCNHYKIGKTGRNHDTGDSLYWMYREDYDQLSPEEQKNIFNIAIKKYAKTKSQHLVLCINTMQVFDSIDDASAYVGLKTNEPMIKACKKNLYGVAGKHPETKQKLYWMFKDNYDSLTPTQQLNLHNTIEQSANTYNRKRRPIYCLNTMQLFKSVKDASDFAGLTSATAICQSCRKTYNHIGRAGQHPETKEILRWMYQDEFEQLSEDDKNKIISSIDHEDKRPLRTSKVYCLNTMQLFLSLQEAVSSCDLNTHVAISNSRHKKNHISQSGHDLVTGEKLYWMYKQYYDELTEEEKEDIKRKYFTNFGTTAECRISIKEEQQ